MNIRKFLPITHKITGTPNSAVMQFTGNRNFLAMMSQINIPINPVSIVPGINIR